MSQNDFNLADQGFPSMRADMNSALQALASASAGATAPATTYAHQLWSDTTANILKIRNADNDGWIDLFALNQSTYEAIVDSAVTLDGLTATIAQLNSVPQLTGRNLIINGSGRVNQRAYASGTATTTANQYTLDRWRVVTSGQNLAFTGTDAGRVMTAPAGGVEQVIEGKNIVGGTYVISWEGTATATVDGTSRAKGDTFTLTANTNATVRFTSGTFIEVQVELGTVATSFDGRFYGQELALCQRYFENLGGAFSGGFISVAAASVYSMTFFKVEKRATPTITTTVCQTQASGGALTNRTFGSSTLNANGFAALLAGSDPVAYITSAASAEL